MSLTPRWALIGLVLMLVGPLLAQTLPLQDKPVPFVPRTPLSPEDIDRHEARRLYAQAVLHERANRLVEAVRAYEAAGRLDPRTAAIPRALAPLYLALDRTDDALAACKQVLTLTPGDYKTGYLLGRQLRAMQRNEDAISVLKRTTRSRALKERPDIAAQIWYDLGLLQEHTGNLASAEKSLRKVIALLDQSDAMVAAGHYTREEVMTQAAETYERLGRICLSAKAVDRAIRAFEEAQKKDAARVPRLAYNLAQVLRDQRQYRESLRQLETYLASEPQGIEGYEMKLLLQRKLRRQADILPDLERASSRDPNNLALKLLLAREYRKGGRPTSAETIYTDLLKRYLNADVYRGLFELYKEKGQAGVELILTRLDASMKEAAGDEKIPGNANAAANARAMLNVLRDDSDLVKMILQAAVRRLGGNLSFATRGVLGTLAARTRQLDLAEQLYRACLDRPAGLGNMEAEVYVGLLEVLQLQHKHAAVVEIAKLGLVNAQQTNRLMFHRCLAYAYLSLEKPKEAEEAAEAAVNDAGKAQLLSMRKLKAYILSEVGKHKEAVAECQAMLQEYNLGGDLREVRLTLSRVYLTMGKHEESDKQLELVLDADPNDATACNDLGYHWADRNTKLEEAERLIRKAIDLERKQRVGGAFPAPDSEKDNAAFIDSLGGALFRRGKLTEAKTELEKAVSLPGGDDDPVVFDHLADVYYRLEEKAKALSAWKKALLLFEAGNRRKSDPRYKEIQDKVRLMNP